MVGQRPHPTLLAHRHWLENGGRKTMSDSGKTPSPLEQIAPNALDTADRDLLLRLVQSVIRVGGILDSVYNPTQVLELIMRESERAVDAEASSLLLYDAETHELTFEVAH